MFQIVVHLLVRWSSRQHVSQRGTPASPSHQGEVPSRSVVFRRLWMFWIVLLAGTLAIASSVVPSSPSLPLVTGNGGPTAASRFCALPLRVAQHFNLTTQAGHAYTASTVPTKAQPTSLPRPTAHGQVFYDPQTNILCAANAGVLQQAWFQLATVVSLTPTAIPTVSLATPTTAPTGTPPAFPTSSNNLWSQGALDALSGIWTGFFHWAGQTIQYVEDWATETLGFMWVTPAALTYKNGIVLEGVHWILSLMDGVLMLLLVVGGYQCLIRTVLGEPRQEVLAFLFRIIIAAIVANFGMLYLIPQLIELNNTLCAGSLQVFLHTSPGDFTVPFLGGVNWLQQPITWSLFFFSLFIQFLQVLVVALGSAFSTSFFTNGSEGSLSPTTLFVGIATLYLAFKLPQLLMQPIVGAIYGDACKCQEESEPVARNPDRDVWLLQRFGQKLHLAELIILPLVAERFTTPQAHQNRKTLIKHLSMYSLIRWLAEIVIFSNSLFDDRRELR